jgi:transmembrane sensor
MPDPSHPSAQEKQAAERAASTWLVRRADGLTPDETREYQAWLAASPANRAAIRKAQLVDELLRELPQSAPEFAPVAARRSTVPASWRWLAAAAGVAALVAAGFFLWPAPPPAAPSAEPVVYAAGSDEARRVTLADGSVVEIARNSSIRVAFTPEVRLVVLEGGQARFSVAKNPHRPFIARAARVSVQAIGTIFNVAVEPAGVQVYVTEGKVQVKKLVEPGPAARAVPPEEQSVEFPNLAAGEGAIIPTKSADDLPSASAGPQTVAAAFADASAPAGLEWRLFFANTRLADVATEFNRRNRTQIVIEDPTLGEREVGGNFRADQPEAFVRLLQNGRDVVVDRRTPDRIVLRKIR